jgi:peptide/nickel transport system permease protein
MIKVIAQKLGVAVAVLFVIVTLTFFLSHLIPGDAARTILGQGATQAQVVALRHQLGLDQPVFTQYVTWMGGLVRGNLGNSIISGQPVLSLVSAAVPVTLSLAVCATLTVLVLGVLFGTLSAVRGGKTDRAIQTGAGVALAVPNFWLAALLVAVFSVGLSLLPATGYVDLLTNPAGWAASLVLPVIAIGLAGIAAVARQTRGALLDTFTRDFIRMLRAVGTPTRTIVLKHALRNASIPIITMVGLQFIGVLGGAVIVEEVFALPGVGQLTLSAVSNHDITVLQGAVIFLAVTVLVVNIVVDIAYTVLNPKLRRR